MAFDKVHVSPEWARTGQLCALLVNLLGDKRTARRVRAEHFMPARFKPRRPPATAQAIRAKLASFGRSRRPTPPSESPS